MNKGIALSIVILLIIGVGVSRLKYEVVSLRGKFGVIKAENEKYGDDIKILNAEWSYLNNPERLKQLAKKHLPLMKPLNNSQIISYDRIVGVDCVEQTENSNNGEHDDFDSLLDRIILGDAD
ncbi:MAG: hypothetical protein LBI26_00790 [Holosporales bacterium]|jgi:hypothetical protein|nr:hypothetical protein [Holosporales bacterium]